jgi:UDP-N-acetylmuramate dehydrogenase
MESSCLLDAEVYELFVLFPKSGNRGGHNSLTCAQKKRFMLQILENISLLPYNTFHIDVSSRYFIAIRSLDDLLELRSHPAFLNNEKLFLGGGSNVLFTKNFDGLVIRNEIGGINIVGETEETITLQVGSGENWHELVMYCVEKDLGGIENLSLIPGTVGAAPMQNIGAYGVEVKNVINSVEALELSTGVVHNFSNTACHFGYRESFFKQEGRDLYFISSITLTLTKKNHRFNTSYGAIQDVLNQNGARDLTVRAISDAVIHIRRSKLPDPAVTGNAGSFFKNPSIVKSEFESLKKNYPGIPGYNEPDEKVKVPAGWLIEQCGWKGKTFSTIGVHPLQALVIVNYGGGKGNDIWQLALDIRKSVMEKFNIAIQPEVNII